MSSEEDINADSSPDSPGNSKDNALFEPKPKPKLIRVLTVFAYILSVSMAAIILSIYYIFMWNDQPIQPRRIFGPNISLISNGFHSDEEMQQQITALQEKEFFSSSTPNTDENTTSPTFDMSDLGFGESSTLMKKLYRKYPYAEDD